MAWIVYRENMALWPKVFSSNRWHRLSCCITSSSSSFFYMYTSACHANISHVSIRKSYSHNWSTSTHDVNIWLFHSIINVINIHTFMSLCIYHNTDRAVYSLQICIMFTSMQLYLDYHFIATVICPTTIRLLLECAQKPISISMKVWCFVLVAMSET